MKISIITASLNCVETIEECIQSIINQTYPNIEHIVIDGGSKDGTLDVVNKYKDKISKVISEPDKGLYDAMNKGIKFAQGDIIGILNSDDVYNDKYVLEDVFKAFISKGVDTCYGDLVYVDREDISNIIRYWKSEEYDKSKFKKGWMPPHPTFFVKKEIYKKYGLFNLDFPLAADYEIMLRFLYKHNVTTTYIPRVLVKMRVGGISKPGKYTLGAIKENYLAWKVNSLDYPITLLFKPISKIKQFLIKRNV